ncbi:hypothetical protein C882_1524 [Caenispirillum salinarum AK4]|uniref:Uncharacterized protein n=1 Tax=Caenispirillum salinarum AK4 TaxID=1238182 RepID=K9H565_9PROT|nr:hypothetical protein C882_1524 [Caenispirillum salinarum AK4]
MVPCCVRQQRGNHQRTTLHESVHGHASLGVTCSGAVLCGPVTGV